MSGDPSTWCPPSDTPPAPPALQQLIPDDVLDGICYRGLQPISITGTIMQFLRNQFKQPNTLGEVTLRNKVWRPSTSPQPTDIVIESIFRWKIKDTGTRPAFIVKPHGAKFNPLSLGDVIKYENNQMICSLGIYGTHTVFVIHSNGEGALWLAQEAAFMLAEVAPIIRPSLRLNDFKVVGWDGIFEIEEARESFAVPINISWYYFHNWKLNQESPILKDVNITGVDVLFP